MPARPLGGYTSGVMPLDSVDDAIRVIRGANRDARWEAERFLSHREPTELVTYLADEDWRVRLVVARALAQIPGPRPDVAEILKSRLQEEDDTWVSNNLRVGRAAARRDRHLSDVSHRSSGGRGYSALPADGDAVGIFTGGAFDRRKTGCEPQASFGLARRNGALGPVRAFGGKFLTDFRGFFRPALPLERAARAVPITRTAVTEASCWTLD